MNKTMTKGERDDLLKLIRSREKVLKSAAEQRAAAMLAEFEQQISKIYAWDSDEVWKKALEDANVAIAAAQKIINDRCNELEIPKEFQPTISGFGWYDRGQNRDGCVGPGDLVRFLRHDGGRRRAARVARAST